MAIDITEQKQTLAILEESERRFKTLASHAPVAPSSVPTSRVRTTGTAPRWSKPMIAARLWAVGPSPYWM